MLTDAQDAIYMLLTDPASEETIRPFDGSSHTFFSMMRLRLRLAMREVTARRQQAALHQHETALPPSDRAILSHATNEERMQQLSYARLSRSLEAEARDTLSALDSRRRSALFRPTPVDLTREDDVLVSTTDGVDPVLGERLWNEAC